MFGLLVLLPPGNFAILTADISLQIAWKETKIALITKFDKLFRLLR